MTLNIVFDFGAVVFDWRPDLLVAQTFAQHAATPSAARLLARNIFHHADWQSFDCGTMALPDVVARTATRLGLPHAELDTLMSGIGERLEPILATVQLLDELQVRRARWGDVRLYYLSNMPQPYARVLEQRHAFLGWFDGGIFSGDVRLIKPQPEIFALLQSKYGLEPAHTVFIDDSAANVEAACVHGWQGIHFRDAEQLASQLPLEPR